MSFEYAGVSSQAYGLYIAAVTESRNLSIAGAAGVSSLVSRRVQSQYYIDTDFSAAPLSFDVEIVSDTPLSGDAQRAVSKWLFHRDGFKRLYTESDSGQPFRTFLNCILTAPVKIDGQAGVYGYKCHVTCDAPCAWQDEMTETFTLDQSTGEDSILSLTIDTDMGEYVYPLLQIDMGSEAGDVTLVNHTDSDSRLTSFSALAPDTTLVMDGRTNFITDGYFAKFKDRNFLRLLDGQNNIAVYGNVSRLTFQWQSRRYL